MRKRLLLYANHKGIYQTAHPDRLSNAVCVNLLDSKIAQQALLKFPCVFAF